MQCIKRRSATHTNFNAEIRGLKPHGYRQETAPRSFKMSKLQAPARRRRSQAGTPNGSQSFPSEQRQGCQYSVAGALG